MHTLSLSVCVIEYTLGRGIENGFWRIREMMSKKKRLFVNNTCFWVLLLESGNRSEWLDTRHISISIMSFRHCDGKLQLILYAVIQQTTNLPSAAPAAFDKNRGKLKSRTWIMNSMTRESQKALSLRCLSWCFLLPYLFWPPSHFCVCFFLHYFNCSVVHYISFSLSSFFFPFWLRIQLLTYSERARESGGKGKKKVSNDDNTQFDKTDKGLN